MKVIKMKSTDIFYFDVDGTILDNKEHKISETTLYSLNQLKELGYKVALCTGRTYKGIHEAGVDSIIDWDGYVLANGSSVLDKDKNLIFETKIDPEIIHAIQEQIAGKALLLEGDSNFLTEKAHEPILRSLKHFGITENYPIKKYVDQKIYNLLCYDPLDASFLERIQDKVQILRDQLGNYEIIPSDAGKDIGILKLNEHLNINHHVAFGDGDNDKTMIENADIGVAMGNSVEELFELADYITSTVDNDGIYNALLKHNVVERMI